MKGTLADVNVAAKGSFDTEAVQGDIPRVDVTPDLITKIAAVDGVDAVFVGPSDLAASMGLSGQQTHPEVLDAVARVFAVMHEAGKPVGVNAFDPAAADDYMARGADFVAVGADVALLARASEALAARFLPAAEGGERASY